jgi:hypothetical protein
MARKPLIINVVQIETAEVGLNQIRTEQPTLLAPLPSGVTDVRFHRILVESAITGVHLKAASAVTPPVTNSGCGALNGQQLTSAPTTGLCSAGMA